MPAPTDNIVHDPAASRPDAAVASAPADVATRRRVRDAAGWLVRRARETGSGYLLRRAWLAWRVGGIPLVRAHLKHAAAQAARETAYREWVTAIEPQRLQAALAAARSATPGGGTTSRSIGGADADDNPRRTPRISILTPLYNTPPSMLHECIRSVLTQTSPHWELILVDDCSPDAHVAEIAGAYASERPDRVIFIRRKTNGRIAAATNDALARATGSFVGFLDHDDVLAPEAVELIGRLIAGRPELDLISTDEDKIDELGRRHGPAFKPAFSPHMLFTSNYICHFLVARTELVRAVGGLRSPYNGAQDYDLVLRLTARTRAIAHVPHVLYHWRSHEGSTAGAGGAKPYAIEAGRLALADRLQGLRPDDPFEACHGPFILTYRARRQRRRASSAADRSSRNGTHRPHVADHEGRRRVRSATTGSIGGVIVWQAGDPVSPGETPTARARGRGQPGQLDDAREVAERLWPSARLETVEVAPRSAAVAPRGADGGGFDALTAALRGVAARAAGDDSTTATEPPAILLIHASVLTLNSPDAIASAAEDLVDAVFLPGGCVAGPRLLSGRSGRLLHAGWLIEGPDDPGEAWRGEPRRAVGGAQTDAASAARDRDSTSASTALVARWRGSGQHTPGYLWDLILPRNVAAVHPACCVLRGGLAAPAVHWLADILLTCDAARSTGQSVLSLPWELRLALALAEVTQGEGWPQVVGDVVLRCDETAAPVARIPLPGGSPTAAADAWPSTVGSALQALARLTPPALAEIEPGFLPPDDRGVATVPRAVGGSTAAWSAPAPPEDRATLPKPAQPPSNPSAPAAKG